MDIRYISFFLRVFAFWVNKLGKIKKKNFLRRAAKGGENLMF